MSVENCIQQIKNNIQNGRYANESMVSQGALLPILQSLNWPVYDISVVIPEYTIEGKRVDFALCHPPGHPKVFIEVKRTGMIEGADRQLFEYAFHQGVPMAILTDGRDWSFFLPAEEGNYQERCVYKLDILERDLAESVERFRRYLNFSKVCSDEALSDARRDYRDTSRIRKLEETLPKAWSKLLDESEEILVELIAEKTEDLCGYKPNNELVSKFLKSQIIPTMQETGIQKTSQPIISDVSVSKSQIYFIYKGKKYDKRKAIEVPISLLKLMAKDDAFFLQKFTNQSHGRRNGRYLDKDKYKLYPNDRQRCERCSVEIVPGWWFGTNISNPTKTKIIELACRVAGLKFGKDVIIHFENA
ncbi:MAG: hypothetical protein C4527_26745 [Candidatus Omnitrophota bacterium]|jgi:hypothetical protein|nr:MAG: hypothetical protein C4527_26745 [Candidatus Omnitrophota bacterium]